MLYEAAEELSIKWWGIEFDGVIELKNRRWKYINGRFCAPIKFPKDIPPIIEMCNKRNSDRTIDEIKGTLLHELVHWRLWSQKLPHRDTDNEFIQECLRVGAPISQASNARRAYERYIRLKGDAT